MYKIIEKFKKKHTNDSKLQNIFIVILPLDPVDSC